MRKAITLDLCDECWKQDSEEVEATYLMKLEVVTVAGGTDTLAYDLCNEHVKALSVREMIYQAHESDDKRGKHTREKVECIHCGKWYSSGSGIALHIKAAHKLERDNHKVIVKTDLFEKEQGQIR